MSEVLEALCARAGRYVGQGINHEGEPFTGRLELRAVVGLRGVVLEFVASGVKGEVFHEEHTLIAPAADGQPALVTLSNNAPGLLVLPQRTDVAPHGEGCERVAFALGDPEERETLRLEQALDLWTDGDVSYRFAWGMPGGEFAERSAVRLRPEAAVGAEFMVVDASGAPGPTAPA